MRLSGVVGPARRLAAAPLVPAGLPPGYPITNHWRFRKRSRVQERALVKEFTMKDWTKAFLAFLSICSGVCVLLTAWKPSYYWVGMILFAGGITFFLTRSKFYKG